MHILRWFCIQSRVLGSSKYSWVNGPRVREPDIDSVSLTSLPHCLSVVSIYPRCLSVLLPFMSLNSPRSVRKRLPVSSVNRYGHPRVHTSMSLLITCALLGLVLQVLWKVFRGYLVKSLLDNVPGPNRSSFWTGMLSLVLWLRSAYLAQLHFRQSI